jgi:SAM-dependent methyltransferase
MDNFINELSLNTTMQTSPHERIMGVAQILRESNERVYDRPYLQARALSSDPYLETGFQPLSPHALVSGIQSCIARTNNGALVFDLGCGNGGFALLAAAAGCASIGVDVNTHLLKEARANLERGRTMGYIDRSTPCVFIEGNIYPEDYLQSYQQFAQKHAYNTTSMPRHARSAPYHTLGVSIEDADIIYAFPWEDQMPFLLQFLKQETRPDALFMLPHYRERPCERQILDLEPVVSPAESRFFVGKRRK